MIKFENHSAKFWIQVRLSGQFGIWHNEELCDLYRLSSIVRVVEVIMSLACSYGGGDKKCIQNLVKPLGKWLFGRPKRA
jgi:hypothetical protein